MILIFGVIWGFMLAAGATAVGALLWSLQHDPPHGGGQPASSILDPDEVSVTSDTQLSRRGN